MCGLHILIVWTGFLIVHFRRCELLHFAVNTMHYLIASTIMMLHTCHKRLLTWMNLLEQISVGPHLATRT